MKPRTAKIMTEYPEVSKLYRVHPWNLVHVPPSFIPSGPPAPIAVQLTLPAKSTLPPAGN
jgi:hypothetical protein